MGVFRQGDTIIILLGGGGFPPPLKAFSLKILYPYEPLR
jgi:hypothetical protein